MNSNRDLLTTLLQTAQRDQVQIRSLLDRAVHLQLRSTMKSGLRELETMEASARSVALQRGWDLPEMDALHCFLIDRLNGMRPLGRCSDSRIAELMIRMHTQGMIRILRAQHRFSGEDPQIRILSQRLLDCERSEILQLHRYL